VLRDALDEQANLDLLEVEPFGEEGSGGSTPLRLRVRRGDDGPEEALFAKLYSATHLRSDRWYKLARTLMYGALEDEFGYNSVRQLVEHEDYMLRVMRDAGVPSVSPRGFVELEPEREYVILMSFLERADEADADAGVDDGVIDAGLRIVREMWDHNLAHRDIKPANVLVRGDDVFLIDVAFGQVCPSPWRQAVDLANMMLVLALGSDPERVYARATELFLPEEIGEAFAAAQGPATPRGLQQALDEDRRDLVGAFRDLAPAREPIAIQRWSVRRVALTVRTVVIAGALLALAIVNLANPSSP
jgi:tRNA A-37 threonylcarbamoyl transferase component Bud32